MVLCCRGKEEEGEGKEEEGEEEEEEEKREEEERSELTGKGRVGWWW